MFALKQVLPRFLQFQSQLSFPASLQFGSNYSTATLPPNMNPDVQRITSFWFDGPEPEKKWFQPPPELDLDNTIRKQFEPLVRAARTTTELDNWTSTADGTLALLILLDQFPRNIYRGTREQHASDPKALSVATTAVAKKQDRQVAFLKQQFFYLPLMHDENLISQVASVGLYEGMLQRALENGTEEQQKIGRLSLGFAEGHRDLILRFGRFPSRNECLGRESTEEEKAYLKEKPQGF